MNIIAGYLMPHAPVMIEEIGKSQTEKIIKTVEAACFVGMEIEHFNPDCIVLISPHGPVFQDAIFVYDFPLKGDFSDFGAPNIKMEFKQDEILKEEIIKGAKKNNISAVKSSEIPLRKFGVREELDHGVLVPLYFVSKYCKEFKLVVMSFGLLPYEDLYKFGSVIKEAAEITGKKIVVIASGDLSHRLTPNAPAGFTPKGRLFDETLVKHLQNFDIEGLHSMDLSLIEKAGECGLRSIWIMLGSLDGLKVEPKVLSYEGPFGVGYCVARFLPLGEGESKLKELYDKRMKEVEKRRQKEDPYVSLARKTVETYVKTGKIIDVPEGLPEEMLTQRAGVFVSIKKHGQLRGCIGTIFPTRKNIAEEIIQNAISAGCEDPRFFPVEEEELPDLTYSVDVLMPPEKIKSKEELDPKKYGVIVRKGKRTGLLLPDLEGIDTVEEQLEIALRKAGISPKEEYEIERFEVERHL
ncbi:AmmeMemoRadiSam system protein A [Thermovenabulum sp.]|uniref:AmmeMemoRadiSam system protein A n=1 Tax=Thermovenabulum sp. TaxID=3100335 RepID=UPI003C79E56D